MKKVFMIGIGGDVEGANIEVHDIQFVLARSIEDTYEELKRRWYGTDISLHIDSYKILDYINGYKVDVNGESKETLYMITYGGSNKHIFGEVHHSDFILASNIDEAEEIASKNINKYSDMDHIDKVIDVFENLGCKVGLEKGDYLFCNKADWQGYIKLG